MVAPIVLGTTEAVIQPVHTQTLDPERLSQIYKANRTATAVRALVTSILLILAFWAFCVEILNLNQLEGVSVCALLLVGISASRLWLIKKHIQTLNGYYRLSLLVNVGEVIGFTAMMYLFGGTDASFLALLYAALISYVGAVAPKRFSFLLAGISALAFLTMTGLEIYQILPHQAVLRQTPLGPQHQLLISLAVTLLLFLSAYISAFTAARFRAIKDHLKEKNEALRRTMKEMEAARDKLRKSQDELEKRVEERTARLSKLTDHLQAEILVREKAEHELRRSEENYRSIFENSVAGFFQSTPEGKFIKVNQAFAKILGYDTPEEVISNIEDISTQLYENPEDRDTYQRQLAEKGHLENFETKVRRKDGSIIWVSTSTRAYFDAKGNPIRYEGVIIDITERKRAEEENERLQEQLIQAQKMESVGRLAGGVAHDFNNMLGVIMGHAELLLMKTPPDSPIYGDMMEISKAAIRSSDLTRQLLAFARKQAIRPKVLDLNETTEGMLKMLRRLIGEEITLAWKPYSRLWRINIDPSQLDQILANLCVNARDAIGGRGTITIETRNVTLDEHYAHTHRGAKPGDYVLLSITDTGCGIPKDIMHKIFEPFFSTKEPGKGTGLGLSTVYGIVKQNNGYIDVYSEPGNGTTFKIYFPRHEEESRPQIRKEQKISTTSNGETILIAEDEPMVLDTIKQVLSQLGYKVLATNHPHEAIRYAETYGGDIHMLITDIVMPHMNGKELSEHILSLRPNIKTLFMSGYTAEAIVQNGIVDADIHFIQKPFTPTDLANMVSTILGEQGHGAHEAKQSHFAHC